MANSIDITRSAFGNKAPAAAPTATRPKAQVWLNVGYSIDVTTTDGSIEKRFVNLPMGIALDTMDEVSTNSSNEGYAALQVAKNSLLKQLIAAAGDLKSGEDRLVNLEVQIRRVNDNSGNADLTSEASNPFLRKLAF